MLSQESALTRYLALCNGIISLFNWIGAKSHSSGLDNERGHFRLLSLLMSLKHSRLVHGSLFIVFGILHIFLFLLVWL